MFESLETTLHYSHTHTKSTNWIGQITFGRRYFFFAYSRARLSSGKAPQARTRNSKTRTRTTNKQNKTIWTRAAKQQTKSIDDSNQNDVEALSVARRRRQCGMCSRSFRVGWLQRVTTRGVVECWLKSHSLEAEGLFLSLFLTLSHTLCHRRMIDSVMKPYNW